MEFINKCYLHLGELLQYSVDNDTILISNTLKDPSLIERNAAWQQYKDEIEKLKKVCGVGIFKAEVTLSVSSRIVSNTALIERILDIFENKYNLNPKVRHKLSFSSSTKPLIGLGLGSSTADIINSSQCLFQMLGLNNNQSDIELILRACEEASDPLYIKNWCLYSSQQRKVIGDLPTREDYIILGFDPHRGTKQVITDKIIHSDGTKRYKEAIEKISQTNIDLWIAEESKKSILFNDIYLQHNIPPELIELTYLPGVGMTGSHSGVMLGLIITNCGMLNILKYQALGRVLEFASKYNCSFYCC